MFFENFPIYYINLENRKDRDMLIKDHFLINGITNFYRVNAYRPEDLPTDTLVHGKKLGCTELETATSFSHILAILNFLTNSKSEYAIFCEDDADISNIQKIKFTISDLFSLFDDADCFQLGVSTRIELFIKFKIHPRPTWSFNASTYVLKRSYAKQILDRYLIENTFCLDGFEQKDIFEYRQVGMVKSVPVSENIVYGIGKTYTCPIFTFHLSESSIQTKDEHYYQNVKSRKDFLQHWSRFDTIKIDDLL